VDDVPTLWKRIDKALKAIPAVKKSLKKGAKEEQIAQCETALGVPFPPDLRASYQAHDGQKAEAEGLFPEQFVDLESGFLLLSLDEIVQEWTTWKQLADGGEFRRNVAAPDAGVLGEWWNPKWLPFASDGGGDFLCVDLAPAMGGTVGQVILLHHAADGRPRKASSFQSLLALLAERLEDEMDAE
jgi:cell wall assembly regulator SMI1